MNVESTSANITTTTTKKTDTATSASSSTTNPSQDTKTSFKDELNSAKNQEAKSAEQSKVQENQTEQNTENTQNSQTEQNAQNVKAAEQNNLKQLAKEKLDEQNETANDKESTLFTKSYSELNSQIAALNDMKNNSQSKIQSTSSKSDDIKSDPSRYCATIKMDNNDMSFYLNLVDNQQMSAQSGQANNNITQLANSFTEVRSEATQKTVQVSATLLDALNESAKTNKPFRIDFDSDVAVIMKVDKNGVLSANFIPGSAAVEQYLKNNIDGLRQSFNDQNLPYNELTYSNREKQNQEKKSKEQKKENNDE